jgi:hypothetical protein
MGTIFSESELPDEHVKSPNSMAISLHTHPFSLSVIDGLSPGDPQPGRHHVAGCQR